MMIEALQYEFMRNAVMAALLASIACGIMGTLVVVNRMVFISGGVAHGAYGGIGIAIFLGVSPLFGAMGFAVFLAIIMALITLHRKQRVDTVIGALWAMGMATGLIFIDLTPGYNVDLMSYLFGSILFIPKTDIWTMMALNAVIVGIVVFFYKDFLALSFDDEYARLMGVPVTTLYMLLLILTALTVVVVMRSVGLILVIALLTIPPYIAEHFAGSLRRTMVLSVTLNTVFTTTGLWLTYTFNIRSGATIIMVAGTFFFLSMLGKYIHRKIISAPPR